MTDLDLAKQIVERCGGTFEYFNGEERTVSMFGQNSTTAVAKFKLPGWRYDVAINSNGEIVYDHFGAEPNTMEHLHNVLRSYNDEIIAANIAQEAASKGFLYSRNEMEDGAIEYVINY
jgi:hypothetical protein